MKRIGNQIREYLDKNKDIVQRGGLSSWKEHKESMLKSSSGTSKGVAGVRLLLALATLGIILAFAIPHVNHLYEIVDALPDHYYWFSIVSFWFFMGSWILETMIILYVISQNEDAFTVINIDELTVPNLYLGVLAMVVSLLSLVLGKHPLTPVDIPMIFVGFFSMVFAIYYPIVFLGLIPLTVWGIRLFVGAVLYEFSPTERVRQAAGMSWPQRLPPETRRLTQKFRDQSLVQLFRNLGNKARAKEVAFFGLPRYGKAIHVVEDLPAFGVAFRELANLAGEQNYTFLQNVFPKGVDNIQTLMAYNQSLLTLVNAIGERECRIVIQYGFESSVVASPGDLQRPKFLVDHLKTARAALRQPYTTRYDYQYEEEVVDPDGWKRSQIDYAIAALEKADFEKYRQKVEALKSE